MASQERGMSTIPAWFAWSVSAAIFAALTAIFAKLGLRGVDSDLATLIRTCVLIVPLALFVWCAGKWSDPLQLSGLARASACHRPWKTPNALRPVTRSRPQAHNTFGFSQLGEPERSAG
jgi:hypothetical protein